MTEYVFSLDSDDEGLMPLPDFCARFGISRSQTYRHIDSGKLVAKKTGVRTLITFSSIRAWWNALPELKQRQGHDEPAPPPKRRARS